MKTFHPTSLGGLAALVLLAGTGLARADEPAPPPPAAAPANVPAPLVVAVLDFQGPKDTLRELTQALPRLLEAKLAESKKLRLVTRADLDRIQEEQALSFAGLVEEGKGADVGKLVGAEVLVVGRVSSVEGEVLLSAKAIGAETGAYLPALVRGGADAPGTELAAQLAARVLDLLVERGGEILPAATPEDAAREKALREAIEKLGVTRPRIALAVPERHVQAPRVADPAAETEMLAAFRRLDFEIAPVTSERERTWLDDAGKQKASFPAPKSLPADLAVVGEAFSEYGGRVGRFVSCRARVEVRAYRTTTGEVVATWVGTGAGADLSEIFAAKKALAALGRRGAYELALQLAKSAAPK